MTVITLNDEQTRLIGEATSPIVLVDQRGREIARVTPASPEHGAALGPEATEEQVLAEIRHRMATHDGTFRLFSELVKELQDRFPE